MIKIIVIFLWNVRLLFCIESHIGSKSNYSNLNFFLLKFHSFNLVADCFLHCFKASFLPNNSIHASTNIYTVDDSCLFIHRLLILKGNIRFLKEIAWIFNSRLNKINGHDVSREAKLTNPLALFSLLKLLLLGIIYGISPKRSSISGYLIGWFC